MENRVPESYEYNFINQSSFRTKLQSKEEIEVSIHNYILFQWGIILSGGMSVC